MIATIKQWLGLDALDHSREAAHMFMSGLSIPQIAARYGGSMLDTQRGVEQALRDYIACLEDEIDALRRELARCGDGS